MERRSVDSVYADQLVPRTLALNDRHPGRGNTRPARDQATQSAIRAPFDRRGAHAREQDSVAKAHELVTARTRLETDHDPRVCHCSNDDARPTLDLTATLRVRSSRKPSKLPPGARRPHPVRTQHGQPRSCQPGARRPRVSSCSTLRADRSALPGGCRHPAILSFAGADHQIAARRASRSGGSRPARLRKPGATRPPNLRRPNAGRTAIQQRHVPTVSIRTRSGTAREARARPFRFARVKSSRNPACSAHDSRT